MPAILITRPAGRAETEMKVCEAAGWHALPFSPISIEADDEALEGLSDRVTGADAVFWVSPSAVDVAAPWLDFSGLAVPQLAVGQASADALAAFCKQQVHAPQQGFDSEAVLQLPVWATLPRGAKVLIIRGRGGRDFLAQSLQQQGFEVVVAEVYRRQPQALDWSLFERVRPQAAYVTSSEIARLLFEQVPPELAQCLKSLLYLTHHIRIANTLRAVGSGQIEVVAGLSRQVLNDALKRRDS